MFTLAPAVNRWEESWIELGNDTQLLNRARLLLLWERHDGRGNMTAF